MAGVLTFANGMGQNLPVISKNNFHIYPL